MNKSSFLEQIAIELLKRNNNSLENTTVVLPNKRAKVFLLNEIRKVSNVSLFSPNIISIEELIQEISEIRSVDAIEILFEFYEVYLRLTDKEEAQSFDLFSSWAKTAIQDFNEIDRYLISPKNVFTYLTEIKALERWNVQPNKKTDLVDKHLKFWQLLPKYYEVLYLSLLDKKIGYQGLIYREAVKNLSLFSKENNKNKFYFVGFNALNDAEEKIILHLNEFNNADVFWDIDEYFLNNEYHDVGLFIRRYKKDWKTFYTKPFEWISQEFQKEKSIQIIGTPKSIGQAKIVGKTIENLLSNGEKLDNCAIVLGDENLLLPVLNSLPNEADSLNITMGYPTKNNPANLLVLNILKLHYNALKRSESNYIFYYKDVISVINHPLIEPYLKSENIIQKIRNNNFTFFNYNTLTKLKKAESYINEELFELLLKPWINYSTCDILQLLKLILSKIKYYLQPNEDVEKLNKTFIFSVYSLVNKIESYNSKYNRIDSIDSLLALYKQLQDISEVSFEGEPLSGLQIMGVLESRVLDFKNIIVTSVNEGKFPSGKSQQSFIPYDIKKELGLPTYKEKDAIYSYHFYHLLFRAENIFLLYNTDSEGIDAGEKSRFLQQLEIEKLSSHSIETLSYNAVLPQKSYDRMEIQKTESLLLRLKEIATEKGFSPSSLTSYIRNPMQFYFQRILRINEADDVEENIAVNTLGTIIHDSLEKLYEPYLGHVLTLEINKEMFQNINSVVLERFKETYKEGNITRGKNYIAFEVAKRNIFNFLKQEKASIENGETIKVLQTEASLECILQNEALSYPVKIAGKVDRIEERNGIIRIIDYKTGKVIGSNLKTSGFEGLTSEIKNDKVIQLLCYALMYQDKFGLPNEGIEAGIISFKNLKCGFLPFQIEGQGRIDNQILSNFTEELTKLINDILDESKNIVEIV
ncbi:PD-(D/E)XK nuclease family protein [Flavobacterium okayamense]|uniref:PD-(D/E)XK endonuclease-like domain-containing protein n=1 Tax=Flavobacterium okayamense TaxID=2830782 RepID=A0ABM7S3Y4_9FLAO|nr:PD-(D/E)XK nuclease family protein [Flavobacterium okayamense]BCY27680.1 hypothetical protein KK2020170_05480 [Flavobacterium okayamense]